MSPHLTIQLVQARIADLHREAERARLAAACAPASRAPRIRRRPRFLIARLARATR